MKQLKTIQLNKDLKPQDIKKFRVRNAARAVVFDKDNKIGLLYVAKNNYHKLPGGGIEEGENVMEALTRECLEEIGCNINVYGELGEIKEFRDKLLLEQHSFCYLADVVGDKGEPSFTQKELDGGFEIKWVSLPEAIKLLKNDKPNDYEGRYIQIRDSEFLKEASMSIFKKTREFVKQSFKSDEAQMRHFDRTVYWIKELKPGADEAYLIAAIGHDIERAFRDSKKEFVNTKLSFRDKEFLGQHAEKGAEILGEFLDKEGADKKMIDRVKHMVARHEQGGDEDQNLLKDADSLSFVENNGPIFLAKIDRLGYDRVKEKFDWMYNRISSKKAKQIGKPFYDKMIKELEKLK
jgi:8-oxo-dGTP diphosphatase